MTLKCIWEKNEHLPHPIKAYILNLRLSPENVSTTNIYKYRPMMLWKEKVKSCYFQPIYCVLNENYDGIKANNKNWMWEMEWKVIANGKKDKTKQREIYVQINLFEEILFCYNAVLCKFYDCITFFAHHCSIPVHSNRTKIKKKKKLWFTVFSLVFDLLSFATLFSLFYLFICFYYTFLIFYLIKTIWLNKMRINFKAVNV